MNYHLFISRWLRPWCQIPGGQFLRIQFCVTPVSLGDDSPLPPLLSSWMTGKHLSTQGVMLSCSLHLANTNTYRYNYKKMQQRSLYGDYLGDPEYVCIVVFKIKILKCQSSSITDSWRVTSLKCSAHIWRIRDGVRALRASGLWSEALRKAEHTLSVFEPGVLLMERP